MQFEMHLVDPGLWWLQFLKVWSGFEKNILEEKKSKEKWNLMKSDEIWWNLMKPWFHQISSGFVRFHQISFFYNFFTSPFGYFPPRSMSNKKYGTPFCGINRPNLLKGNCNSAELWTLRKIFKCINVWKYVVNNYFWIEAPLHR